MRLCRAPGKSMYFLLSRTQAGPGRTVKQEQEETSCNHVQTFSGCSVYSRSAVYRHKIQQPLNQSYAKSKWVPEGLWCCSSSRRPLAAWAKSWGGRTLAAWQRPVAGRPFLQAWYTQSSSIFIKSHFVQHTECQKTTAKFQESPSKCCAVYFLYVPNDSICSGLW